MKKKTMIGDSRQKGQKKHRTLSKGAKASKTVTVKAGGVTDKKRTSRFKYAKKALHASEAKVHALLNATSDAVFLLSPEGVINIANQTGAQRLEKTLDELVGKSFYDFFPADVSKRRKKWIQGIVKSKRPSVHEDEMDGRYLEHSIYPVIDRKKNITMVAIFVRDITKRRRAEEALKESEERLRALVNGAPIAINITRKGITLYASRASLDLFGYHDDSEIVGTTILNEIAPQCRSDVWYKTMQHEKSEQGVISYETTGLKKDGTEFPMLVSISRTIFPDGPANVVFMSDLTNRKLMEDALLRARNLESIGTLAGGIAHDFNNLLMGVTGYIELAKTQITPENKAYSLLTEAEKVAEHGKDLTLQLVTFSMGGEPLKNALKVGPLLKNVSRLTLSGSSSKCEYFIDDDLYRVEADEAQLRQVIHNIVLNAKEAMPKGGVITVRAQNVSITKQDAMPLSTGEYVKISIEDKGVGIPQENIQKIFDPYFSTKGMGVQKGMGLGLAIVYSIIKRHNGYITVESMPGTGTVFTIYLPAHIKKPVPSAESAEDTLPAVKRILFMDDEAFIRNIGNEILTHLGYDVTLAQDGIEAIALYKQELEAGRPFDAVILDLTMKGGIGGKDVLGEIKTFDPNVRAIISSGYTEDPILSDYASFGFKAAIKKPYSIDKLREVLRGIVLRMK